MATHTGGHTKPGKVCWRKPQVLPIAYLAMSGRVSDKVPRTLKGCSWPQAELTWIFQRFQSAFSRFEVVISPTTPVTPFPWREPYPSVVQGNPQDSYYRCSALTYVVTLASHPALSRPLAMRVSAQSIFATFLPPPLHEESRSPSSSLSNDSDDGLCVFEHNPQSCHVVCSIWKYRNNIACCPLANLA
ncbi:amidase family protein [Paraburkholderia azotifigens]|uniref:Amidase family protein n=1 Tax=Paraburkholderia azotifigens TaxID=2057004 RepID=A0A5C6V7I6_9BURK|nr:hypothetical protein FRZ40_41885 [Paraburkholderia azotifigens]